MDRGILRIDEQAIDRLSRIKRLQDLAIDGELRLMRKGDRLRLAVGSDGGESRSDELASRCTRFNVWW